jgi:hypothetical protein
MRPTTPIRGRFTVKNAHACFRGFALLLVCLLCASPSWALWPKDGVQPLASFNSSPYDARTVSDGEGGSIIVWWDWYPGGTNLVAQRLDPYGRKLWSTAGVLVAPGNWYQGAARAVSDGAGGIIVAWMDSRTGPQQVFAQRINGGGQLLWGATGTACTSVATTQFYPCVDHDGNGGAVIAWQDDRNGDNDVYAQRINASGYLAWGPNGVLAGGGTANQSGPSIAVDGAGGAVIAFEDDYFGFSSSDILFQRLASDGTAYFGSTGALVCGAVGRQYGAQIVSDGGGGALIAWRDQRSGTEALFAERMTGAGATAWSIDGISIGTQLNYTADVASDGNGGMFLAWEQSMFSNVDLRLQHVTRDGTFLCAAGGAPVCTLSSNSLRPQVIADGGGGAIVAWQDDRSGTPDIYAQRLSDVGAASWTTNGVVLCGANAYQQDPDLASDGEGGAILAWQDWRDQQPRMSAQRVDRFGNWGLPAAEIRNARDVPGDQGGRINLSWFASRLDPWPSSQVARYTLWRAIAPGAKSAAGTKSAAVPAGAKFVTADAVPATVESSVFRRETAASRTFFWEMIGSVDAYHLTGYGATVASLWDSTAAAPGLQYFQVIAHGTDPSRFWISAPDSARSVDNLAPAAPLGLAGALATLPAGLALDWRRSPELDLSHYALYRGTSASFVPGPGNLVAAVADTSFTDAGWPGAGAWYKLTALDIHGNESGVAVLAPAAVAGVTDGVPRLATSLAPVQPNPFNPSTRLAWSLAESGPVTLRIHDAAGRVVRSVVTGPQAAGPGSWVWDGRDEAGRPAASGVYYVRLSAGGKVLTQKATLVK